MGGAKEGRDVEDSTVKGRIVFAFLGVWKRLIDSRVSRSRQYEMEYKLLRKHVGSNAGLLLGGMEAGGAAHYMGVFVLREKLATVGEVRSWLDEKENGYEGTVYDGAVCSTLGDFLAVGNEQVVRPGWEVYGEPVFVEEGDEEKFELVAKQGAWRERRDDEGDKEWVMVSVEIKTE